MTRNKICKFNVVPRRLDGKLNNEVCAYIHFIAAMVPGATCLSASLAFLSLYLFFAFINSRFSSRPVLPLITFYYIPPHFLSVLYLSSLESQLTQIFL